MSFEIKCPKKLIEVALPLDAINIAAAREKSIRHGHPSTFHLWWARRPLAVARAVIFAQMVNDPGFQRELNRGVNKKKALQERQRLFGIIERLVKWENSNNESVLNEAREEIKKSWIETCEMNQGHPEASTLFNPNSLPTLLDPFAGGGSIPIEAVRLGLHTIASDLNPVAVLINKALIDVPARFCDRPPVGLTSDENILSGAEISWKGSKGLAEDIRRYAVLVRAKAFQKVGHLYPQVKIDKEMTKDRPDLNSIVGEELNVIAWIWARTVKSPSPAFSHAAVPLVSSYMLSTKAGKEAYLRPIVKGDKFTFQVVMGAPKNRLEVASGTKLSRGANFKCLLSNTPIEPEYIKSEGRAGRLGTTLIAAVAAGAGKRIFLPATKEMVECAENAVSTWSSDLEIGNDPRSCWTPPYGLTKFGDLFTKRQTAALNAFSDAIKEIKLTVVNDAIKAGWKDDGKSLSNGGLGATAYGDAVITYLAFGLSRSADYWSNLCIWRSDPKNLGIGHVFSKQSLPMVWDFAEANPFSDSSGNWTKNVDWVCRAVEHNGQKLSGVVEQKDACSVDFSGRPVVSTDPPYYDNIPYANLSDFFYVWLQRTLGDVFPPLFSTSGVPKADELVASPYRHGGKKQAEEFFMSGMTKAVEKISDESHPAFPSTIYYAFKQSETKNADVVSTGWETFLEAVIKAGFSVVATWPMRTELSNRTISVGTNVLASSIVLACRKRGKNSLTVSRREFVRELNALLPEALQDMTTGSDHSPVAPVDLSQAIIGPGMAVFSKYSAVLEADGQAMSVKTALQLINRFLAQEDFDRDTQFCLSWFEAHGWDKGTFGDADVLARAKGTSVDGLRESGVVESAAGALQLLRPDQLPEGWSPEADTRLSAWELLQHMVGSLNSNGESAAGAILSRANNYSEDIRTLAYRLYTLCERKGWSQDAGNYNALILAWDAIENSARTMGYAGDQISLFADGQSEQKIAVKQKPKKRTKE